MRLTSPEDVAAELPALIGYQPQEGQMAVLPLDQGSRGSSVMVFTISDNPIGRAPLIQDYLEDRAPEHDTLLLMGYGATAARCVEALAGLHGAELDAGGVAPAVFAFRVDGKEVSELDEIYRWMPVGTIPDRDAEHVLAGHNIASDRGEFLRTVEPDPVPSWSALEGAELSKLQALPLHEKFDRADVLLEQLPTLEGEARAAGFAAVSALAENSAELSDYLAAKAAMDSTTFGTVREGYLTGPVAARSSFADATAVGLLAQGNYALAREIAEREGTPRSLQQTVVLSVAEANLPVEAVRDVVQATYDDAQLERRDSAARVVAPGSSAHRASFPSPAGRSERAAGDGGRDTGPRRAPGRPGLER